jgi:hypothetical protein
MSITLHTDDDYRRLVRSHGLLLQSFGLPSYSYPLARPTASPFEFGIPVEPEPLTRRTYRGRVVATLAAAEGEWRRGVREPLTPGDEYAALIDGYIRGPVGLDWPTTDVRTWKPGVPYRKNRDFAWCGAFAAWCWSFGGLRHSVRYSRMAGTGRLWSWVRNTARHVKRWQDLKPGDLAIFDNIGQPPGDHITLVRDYPRQTGEGEAGVVIPTYEGNAVGGAPNVPGAPARWEGVVVNDRRLVGARGQASFAYGVHFDEAEDFDP